MGYSFLEFMKRIGVFIICAQSFLHFSAGKSYEKYVKLLIGIMVLVQFVVLVKAILPLGESQELWEEVERFQKELEDAAGEIAWNYEGSNEAVLTLEKEIKQKIDAAAVKYGVEAKEVKVYEDPPMVEIMVRRQREGRIEVEKIKVGGGKDIPEEKYSEMRQEFASILNTDEVYIMIKEE